MSESLKQDILNAIWESGEGWQPTKKHNTKPPNVDSGVVYPSAHLPKDIMWYIYGKPRKVKIYDISYDSTGYPIFLIYIDGQWIRKSAKYFRPIGE